MKEGENILAVIGTYSKPMTLPHLSVCNKKRPYEANSLERFYFVGISRIYCIMKG